ncbi:small ribosomal subunit protein eS21y isoform X1 [Ziziphus jujuba]|uniref:Small ribosomal subunit protein eS21y isoform X1 n=1 Tax=Ziziphus jujuba TaxID=326968 RepID=A0ABM3I763_ZIZJJ|nr:small ribosomal subunit protein eS21y isoform X1 [Ziziphus jujuba]XP_048321981.1 small ribosomal subunit protein eS21y isoform X1 [Ziziphus jujuba]
MQNEEGVITELYIPRKCSATNRLITSKDHASVQINVGHLDENGVYTGQFSTFALCGFVRAQRFEVWWPVFYWKARSVYKCLNVSGRC